ncbi:MAG TPA: TonB-dependent receptor [Longimicrobium sp.]|uniref:TonB-dependent receptor plug domain-containing protein n=1 Tax=Longimicrobium sp. TaxID=2029185 RepID=UPI002EDA3485
MRVRSLLVLSSLAPAALAAQERAVPLDTVRVSAASRTASEAAAATRGIEVVTAEQIRALPARTLADVLEWALAVDVMPRSPALADVSVRGGSFEQVLVMVDGVRASDAQTGHFDLNLAVPLDQVERIEIVRGPASALFGADAVGGVIHVVTRRDAGGPRARAQAGTWNTRAVSASYAARLGAARADLGGEWQRSDGHRPGTDYDVASGRLALTVPAGGGTVNADVAHAARDFGAEGFYGPFPSYEETRTTTATLAFRALSSARLAVEPTLSVRRHADDYVLRRDDPEFYRNQHTNLRWGGEVMARWHAAPRLRLAGGAEWFSDELESARLGDRAEPRAGALLEAAAGTLGRATATAGVRADWHERYGTEWSPSVAAAWWPAPGVRLRASAARAFRAPTWTERYYQDPANVGDPDLQPERSWSAEAGASAFPGHGVRLGIAAFVRDADQLIDWARPDDAPAEPWRTRNVEEARFRGIEAEAGWSGPLGLAWSATGAWLSVATEEADGFTSKSALRPVVENVALSLRRTFAERLTLTLLGRRARRTGDDAYVRLDARAAYDIRGVRVFADVQNATGAEYLDITRLAAPGRAFTVGLEWSASRGR